MYSSSDAVVLDANHAVRDRAARFEKLGLFHDRFSETALRACEPDFGAVEMPCRGATVPFEFEALLVEPFHSVKSRVIRVRDENAHRLRALVPTSLRYSFLDATPTTMFPTGSRK